MKELKLYFLWCAITGPLVIIGGTYAGLSELVIEAMLGVTYFGGLWGICSYYSNEDESDSNRKERMHEMQQDGNDSGKQRPLDKPSISGQHRKKKHRRSGSESNRGDALSDIHIEQPSGGELQGSQPDANPPGNPIQPPG